RTGPPRARARRVVGSPPLCLRPPPREDRGQGAGAHAAPRGGAVAGRRRRPRGTARGASRSGAARAPDQVRGACRAGRRRARMRTIGVALIGAVLALGPLRRDAAAHALSPALLEVEEIAGDRIAVAWKLSAFQPAGAALDPVLPPECVADTAPAETVGADSITTRWTARCPGGLVGRAVGVDGLATGKTDA